MHPRDWTRTDTVSNVAGTVPERPAPTTPV